MNSELSNHVSESDWTKMHNSEPENLKKLAQPRGAARKILQRGSKVTKHGTAPELLCSYAPAHKAPLSNRDHSLHV